MPHNIPFLVLIPSILHAHVGASPCCVEHSARAVFTCVRWEAHTSAVTVLSYTRHACFRRPLDNPTQGHNTTQATNHVEATRPHKHISTIRIWELSAHADGGWQGGTTALPGSQRQHMSECVQPAKRRTTRCVHAQTHDAAASCQTSPITPALPHTHWDPPGRHTHP